METIKFLPFMRTWLFSLLVLAQVACLPAVGQTGSGSGFMIHPDGYVLTNHHVIADAAQITVVVSGKGKFPASIVADDDYKDLALLKIEAAGLDALPIAESKNVNVLDTIFVLGYPLASALGADVSASQGQVNAVREDGRIPLFQIDANVNPGNSGGPVVNDRGEVIGVVVSKLNAAFFLRETGSIPERVNFAIPIDEARGMVRKAYPFGFNPSARTEHLTAQQIFDQSRKATVLIISEHGGTTPKLSTESKPSEQPASQSIVDFVKAFVESSNSGSTANLVDFYAAKVNYFDHGWVDRDFIATDVANYRKRWPIRRYSIISGPDVVYAPGQDMHSATYRIWFEVQSPEKRREGIASDELLIGQIGDRFFICAINQTIEKTLPSGSQSTPKPLPTPAKPAPASQGRRPTSAEATAAINRAQDAWNEPRIKGGVRYDPKTDTYNWTGPKGQRRSKPASWFLDKFGRFLD
jgi:hypothetical protein